MVHTQEYLSSVLAYRWWQLCSMPFTWSQFGGVCVIITARTRYDNLMWLRHIQVFSATSYIKRMKLTMKIISYLIVVGSDYHWNLNSLSFPNFFVTIVHFKDRALSEVYIFMSWPILWLFLLDRIWYLKLESYKCLHQHFPVPYFNDLVHIDANVYVWSSVQSWLHVLKKLTEPITIWKILTGVVLSCLSSCLKIAWVSHNMASKSVSRISMKWS